MRLGQGLAADLLEPLAAATEDAGFADPGDVDRRHPCARARGSESRQYHGSILALHRRCRAPAQRLRLHDEPRPRRSGDVPRRLPGFLQADAYGGYDGIFLGSSGKIVEVACWAHAAAEVPRRRSNAPAPRRIKCWSGSSKCTTWKIRAASMTAAERRTLTAASRCRSSIESRDIWMSCRMILPKSTLGKSSATYARNQRAALRQFVSDGRLTIDSNVSERTVRIQAIGRKNWEFLGSPAAWSTCGGPVHNPCGSEETSSSGAMGLCSRRTASAERG